MNSKQSELGVITKAKDLCKYIMQVTQKCPKHFRFTFVTRLQTLALSIIENLYRANDTFVGRNMPQQQAIRLNYQHKALTDTRLLAYFAELALEANCILLKQFEQISTKTTEVMRMIGAWINSDRKRFAFS